MYKFTLISAVNIALLLTSNLAAASNCKLNNIYEPYSVPFNCGVKNQQLTKANVNTVNFHYTQQQNHCTVISNTAQTMYLNHNVNCGKNSATMKSRKIELSAGENSVDFESTCYKDSNNNQANFYIDHDYKTTAPKLMISCVANNKAVGPMDDYDSTNNVPSVGAVKL
jgi:nitroimidazol reductase NimA-like FMN-containing flavoprotein (pyridoxamine 5'-phosphate oxidase superfamily)